MNYTYWRKFKDELPEDGVVCVFHIKGRKPVTSRGMSLLFGNYQTDYGFFDRANCKFYPPAKIDYWMPITVLPEK